MGKGLGVVVDSSCKWCGMFPGSQEGQCQLACSSTSVGSRSRAVPIPQCCVECSVGAAELHCSRFLQRSTDILQPAVKTPQDRWSASHEC